jgi:hypothetical protein
VCPRTPSRLAPGTKRHGDANLSGSSFLPPVERFRSTPFCPNHPRSLSGALSRPSAWRPSGGPPHFTPLKACTTVFPDPRRECLFLLPLPPRTCFRLLPLPASFLFGRWGRWAILGAATEQVRIKRPSGVSSRLCHRRIRG